MGVFHILLKYVYCVLCNFNSNTAWMWNLHREQNLSEILHAPSNHVKRAFNYGRKKNKNLLFYENVYIVLTPFKLDIKLRSIRLNRPIASSVRREAGVTVIMCVIAGPAHIPWSPGSAPRIDGWRCRAKGKDRDRLRIQWDDRCVAMNSTSWFYQSSRSCVQPTGTC